MKLLDRFLKILNVNRNTFFTFILTLITFYICVDRLVEMLLMFFTGISSSYWGPIKYTFALACPAFAFAFMPKSSFAHDKQHKQTLFYVYSVGMYIIAVSMFTQWLNGLLWLLFSIVPNYTKIVTEFPSLVRHAFCAVSIYLPLVTVYPFIAKKLVFSVDDSQERVKSLWEYTGIDLSDSSAKHNAYMCDVTFLFNQIDGKKITYAESCRYRSMLVCGGSGTGKTARVFEPMISQDIAKKYFFKEASKELGFTALKTGIASLNSPYSNEYLNENFNLNMLVPSFGKDAIFKTFMKKMVLSTSPITTYRNIGVTYISPDNESIEKMMSVCDNYNVRYTLIDPESSLSTKGLNPFVYDDPSKIATTISYTLNAIKFHESEEISENIVIQILENLSILLKLIYPKMHDGSIPNMEDLLNLLNNFELVNKMCKILKSDEELSEDYEMLITYLERNFYKESPGFDKMQEYSLIISSRLENLLRSSKIKSILCNRFDNIDFDKALANGEFIFLCTRRGEVGRFASQALGFFFLLSMQNAVLRRPGNEHSRIPYYLYIDEFPDYLNYYTETIFTMYRKYCVGTTISAQSISMLKDASDSGKINSTVLANCSNKIFTGGAAPREELEWWNKEMGQFKEWSTKRNFDETKLKMDPKYGDVSFAYKDRLAPGQLQFLPDNTCGYKIIGDNGKPQNGPGIINFMENKHKEKHKSKTYDFEKYSNSNGVSDEVNDDSRKFFSKRKPSTIKKNSETEIDPIQNDPTVNHLFNNDNAIVINFKNKKEN